MSDLTPYQAGRIVKAARDKAEDEIPQSTLWPCTVVQVGGDPASGFDDLHVFVHMDGDPDGYTQQVARLGGFEVHEGDKAMVQYTPPHGMTLVAPANRQRPAAISVSLGCTHGGGG